MKRAIVTGATGMIASALIRELISRDIEVYALCPPGDARSDAYFASPLVHALDADIRALPDAAAQIDKPCDVLYHFSWLGTFGGGRDDVYTQNDNVRWTLDAVTLAQKTGCGCFVGAGSQAEYGRTEAVLNEKTPAFPETGYGIAKCCAGRLSALYAKSLGIRHVWVRILSVFGQKGNPKSIIMDSLDKLLRGEHVSFTKGEQLWDFLHCDDAAYAFYLVGEKGRDGAIYPLGSGQPRTLADYIRAMCRVAAPDVTPGIGERPYPPGQVMKLEADISALVSDTGFAPRLSFEEGVERTMDWMKGNASI